MASQKRRKKRWAIFINEDDPLTELIKAAAKQNNRKIIDEIRERFTNK